MTELTIALNFIIIFLLVTAIIYGFVLNRRINLIRDSGRELSHLFRSFDGTVLKAQNSIDDLKRISGAISEGLQKKIDKAAMLMDELEFMREKAVKAADEVSELLGEVQHIQGRAPVSAKKNTNVVPMPLVMAPPAIPAKSMVPAKSSSLFNRKKALEDMLGEVEPAPKAKPVVNNNVRVPAASANKNSKQLSDNEKKQFSIVSALKALGYGE